MARSNVDRGVAIAAASEPCAELRSSLAAAARVPTSAPSAVASLTAPISGRISIGVRRSAPQASAAMVRPTTPLPRSVRRISRRPRRSGAIGYAHRVERWLWWQNCQTAIKYRGDLKDPGASLSLLAEHDYRVMQKDEADYDWIWDACFFGRGLLLLNGFDRSKGIMAPVTEVIDPLMWKRDPRATSATATSAVAARATSSTATMLPAASIPRSSLRRSTPSRRQAFRFSFQMVCGSPSIT